MRNYELIGRRVEERYPFLLPELERVPALADVNQINRLYKEYSKSFVRRHGTNRKNERYFKALFVAIVFKMYCPDYVDGYSKKVKSGIRAKLADIFHYSQSNITNLFKFSLKNLLNNTKFSIEVEYFYKVLNK